MVLFALISLAPSPLKKIETKNASIEIAPQTAPEAVEAIKQPEAADIQPEPKVAVQAAPAPVAEPKPSPATCASEIAKYDWPQNVARAIAMAESRLIKDNHGDKTLTYYQNGIKYGDSWGCFQVRYLPGRPTPSELIKPEVNVAYAYKLYTGSGWHPWTMWKNGEYRKHLWYSK